MVRNGPIIGWREPVSCMTHDSDGKFLIVGGLEGGLGVWWFKEE